AAPRLESGGRHHAAIAQPTPDSAPDEPTPCAFRPDAGLVRVRAAPDRARRLAPPPAESVILPALPRLLRAAAHCFPVLAGNVLVVQSSHAAVVPVAHGAAPCGYANPARGGFPLPGWILESPPHTTDFAPNARRHRPANEPVAVTPTQTRYAASRQSILPVWSELAQSPGNGLSDRPAHWFLSITTAGFA